MSGSNFINEASIVPNLEHNLISASKLTLKGYKIIVEKDGATINAKNSSINCDHKSGFNVLIVDSIIAKSKKQCNIAVDEDVWHRKVGYAVLESLSLLRLSKSNLIGYAQLALRQKQPDAHLKQVKKIQKL